MASSSVIDTADSSLVRPKDSGVHRIDQLILGYRGAKALMVAVTLDVFSLIDSGHQTVQALCRRTRTKPRPTRVLLDALAALGFLTKREDRYFNNPLSQVRLVKGKPNYLGDNLQYQDFAWDCWSGLGSLVRTGKSEQHIWSLLSKSPRFANAYIQGMDNISATPAQLIAERLPVGKAQRVLDVGAGPGAYTRALLEKHPALTATLFDLPPSLKVAKNILKGHPLAARIRLRPGNYLTDSLGKNAYDIVFISHVTHNEDETTNETVIRKAVSALRPGGQLVIHDFTVEDDGAGPLFAALLSLHMLVTTGNGRIYSKSEYRQWMHSAGLTGFQAWPVGSDLENPTWILQGFKD